MQLLSLVALAALASRGLTGGAEAKKFPLVILPSSFRWNSTNTITVTPLKLIRSNEVDSEFRVEDSTGVIYAREDLIWKAGVANSKHFFLSAPSSNPSALPHELASDLWTLIFDLQNFFDNTSNVSASFKKLRLTLKEHEPFETTVKTSTDLRVVHVYSDKAHYRSGETVTIRALPLDFYNQMYTKPIEFVLINPGRFELLRHRSSSINGRFVQARMKLPLHLQHGEWRIEARPVESHEAAGTVYFNVHDYVLPNFELAISVDQETTDITHVPVTVKARYTHTVLVEGGLNIYCFNRTHSILQDTENRVDEGVHDNEIFKDHLVLGEGFVPAKIKDQLHF
ncbi:hypothetical protein PRIPAC_73798 [Pristionchus pacificus]|uniref:MG2 domain-containing protein n=1 Tax=Pristionchus pacificus TaxID=54126 RepID=A0A2A6C7B6_PRIPA|nr:hypothetical protein PRIPAC_73798 [Pristionchus pacificus]|eukprot:PDM73953.1 hypothetical protein PRIPAC_41309 [Pristionchus pacificus]